MHRNIWVPGQTEAPIYATPNLQQLLLCRLDSELSRPVKHASVKHASVINTAAGLHGRPIAVDWKR